MITKAIYKYELPLLGENIINLPAGAEVLSAGLDPSDKICVWAMVDITEPAIVPTTLLILGTGWNITDEQLDGMRFLSTVRATPYIWHIFMRKAGVS